jgi:hypothetical protein
VDVQYSEIIHALSFMLLFMSFNKTPAAVEALKRKRMQWEGECKNIPNAVAALKSLFL